MVLFYVRGLWWFKVVSLVVVIIRYGNVGDRKLNRKFGSFILMIVKILKFNGNFLNKKNTYKYIYIHTLYNEKGIKCIWYMLTKGVWERFWR